jgi:hypothetical protein
MTRTHFKTDFEARSSEKLVGKAGGEKGPGGVLKYVENPFCRQRSPTSFAADRSRKVF